MILRLCSHLFIYDKSKNVAAELVRYLSYNIHANLYFFFFAINTDFFRIWFGPFVNYCSLWLKLLNWRMFLSSAFKVWGVVIFN